MMCEIAGILTADVSNRLFFSRVAEGVPLTSLESVWYWYYLPALFMIGVLAAAFMLSTLRLGSARLLAGILWEWPSSARPSSWTGRPSYDPSR